MSGDAIAVLGAGAWGTALAVHLARADSSAESLALGARWRSGAIDRTLAREHTLSARRHTA